jgi:hypothetical protein
MIPEYLNEIKSDKKALELADILEAIHPTHAERLWLVGFLKFAGYSMPEVLDIIREHNHWCDYDARNTAYQVGTSFATKTTEMEPVTLRSVKNPISKVS